MDNWLQSSYRSPLHLCWGATPSDMVNSKNVYELYALKKTGTNGRAPLEGDVIVDAKDEFDHVTGRPCVSMSMNSDGARRWATLTKANVGKAIAIVLDDAVYSAPRVNGEISGGNSQITGNFTVETTKDLANTLKSGRMPAPARIVQEEVVGPTLGAQSIKQGIMSFIVAFILLMIYMVMMYASSLHTCSCMRTLSISSSICSPYGCSDLDLVFRPFIKVEGLTSKEFRQQKVSITGHTAIVFTSRHAIDNFFKLAKEMRLEIPEDMKYFCVTEQIAFYIQKYVQYRKRKVFFGQTGKITDLVPSMVKHKTEKFLIPMSDVHDDTVKELLDSKKLQHTECIMYRTVSNDFTEEEVKAFDYDMCVFFSPAGSIC